MTDLSHRRGFLRGLAALPLIGGGVSLIGKPTAAAVPVTPELLAAYNQWLFYERRLLLTELFPDLGQRRIVEMCIPHGCPAADRFHSRAGRSAGTRNPNRRAVRLSC